MQTKIHKVTNCDRRISIGKEVDPKYLIQFRENSCPFKIAEDSEIGIIIHSDKFIWKNVRHVKIHLDKSKINPNNKVPDKNYLFAIVTCYGITRLAIPGFICCSIDLNYLISFLHSSKLMTNHIVFSSIDKESIKDKFFMVDNKTIQHSFFQVFLTQNMSQYSQSNEN